MRKGKNERKRARDWTAFTKRSVCCSYEKRTLALLIQQKVLVNFKRFHLKTVLDEKWSMRCSIEEFVSEDDLAELLLETRHRQAALYQKQFLKE